MQHIFIKVIISSLLCVGIISNSKSQVKTKIFNEGIPDKFIPIHKLIIPEKVIVEPTEFTRLLNQALKGDIPPYCKACSRLAPYS